MATPPTLMLAADAQAVTEKPTGPPLAARLGIRDGMALCTMGAPAGLLSWLHPLPVGVHFVRSAPAGAHVVLFFTDSSAELGRQLRALGPTLPPQAALWVCFPTRESGVSTDVYHRLVNCMGLPQGLVEAGDCRLHPHWSAVKMVSRRAPQRARRQ